MINKLSLIDLIVEKLIVKYRNVKNICFFCFFRDADESRTGHGGDDRRSILVYRGEMDGGAG
jgi:hypothetical protein